MPNFNRDMKRRKPLIELNFPKYHTHAPHIDGGPVLQAEDDLRAAVEARLDVGVHPRVRVARAAEVYHLDGWTASRLQQDVLLEMYKRRGILKVVIKDVERK